MADISPYTVLARFVQVIIVEPIIYRWAVKDSLAAVVKMGPLGDTY